ncbi:MAG TPA: hypothetical protein VHW69_13295 [Rhizomicrobium sp.]|nr:hypothetical protein [Rhizomicrobium sp.]
MKTTTQLLAVGRSYNPKGGAPRGNRNALKTGRYTADKQALRRQIAAFIRNALAVAAMSDARVTGRGQGKGAE